MLNCCAQNCTGIINKKNDSHYNISSSALVYIFLIDFSTLSDIHWCETTTKLMPIAISGGAIFIQNIGNHKMVNLTTRD